MKSVSRCAMVMLVAMLAVGCAPWATYPPIEAGTPLTSAELPPFPTLMAEAIWHVNYEYGTGNEQFAYDLPAGTTPLVFEKVATRLGAGIGERQLDAATPAIHVCSVRSRGTQGEVDVIYPRRDGLNEMVTVRFRNEAFRGWFVVEDRRWRFPVEPPPPSITLETGTPLPGATADAEQAPPGG